MPTPGRARIASLAAVWLALVAGSQANAQSTQPVYALHSFSGPDGSRPDALTQGADGNLYGATSQGGTDGAGAVYRIAPDGTFTPLYSFSAVVTHSGGGIADPAQTNGDGSDPVALVRDGGGNVWGIANGAGASGHGTVFEIPAGGAFRVVHTFSPFTIQYQTVGSSTLAYLSNADGARPSSLALGPDGNVYGTATGGGTYGNGTVFRLTTSGGAFSTLYAFSQMTLPAGPVEQTDLHNADGAAPDGAPLVVGPDGALYGMTSQGGPGGLGTVFRITLGGALTALSAPGNGYAFLVVSPGAGSVDIAQSTGAAPVSLALAGDGNFYGTVGRHITGSDLRPDGGTAFLNGGSVFRMGTDGAITPLFNFAGVTLDPTKKTVPPPGGADPSSLVPVGGSFYGTARAGTASDVGTVFRLSPDAASATGYSLTTLYVPVVDGAQPANLLLARDGNLYGTGGGGVGGNGVVFEVAPTPPPFVIHSFSGTEGFNPVSLLFGTDGNLYGAAYSSTANMKGIGDGTFFTLTPDSTPAHDTLKVLYDQFHYTRNNTGLTLGSDGLFYGTTSQQGPGPQGYGAGGIYSISAGGLLSDLFDFPGGGNPAIGGSDFGGVIQGAGGLFYGTTNTVTYAFNPVSKVLTPLHTFVYQSNGPSLPDDGTDPQGNLLLASDGRLYGVTGRGGQDPNSGEGTIYSLDPNGAAPGYGFRVLHRFNPAGEGGNSSGGLVEGKDGALYGTLGAIYYSAAVFKINKDGTGFQVLHALPFGEGYGSTTPLLLANDGFFYGMVGAGGVGGGSIFRISAGGDFRTVYRFSGPDGEDHYNGDFVAPLTQGPGGDLYGVAGSGGLYGYTFNPPYVDGFGTVFHLATTRPSPQAVPAATDVTAQMTLQYHNTLVAGKVLCLVTLTNTGAAVPGPLSLALDNLPAGTLLLSADGQTNRAAPAGSPYAVLTGGGLATGASVSKIITLSKLLTPSVTRRVLSGPGAP